VNKTFISYYITNLPFLIVHIYFFRQNLMAGGTDKNGIEEAKRRCLGYPVVKRAKLKQQTCTSLEDAEEIVGALGKTTSSAQSNLLLNGIGDDKDDDDALVLDTDKDLLQEMDELLKDLKL
jgi:hypothetical protein